MLSAWKFFNTILFACFVTLVAPAIAVGQVASIQPRIINPGATVELTVRGKGLQSSLRIASTLPDAAMISLQPVDDTTAKLLVTLPTNTSLGPAGVWLDTAVGPGEPQIIVVDDLPATLSTENNNSQETAQSVSTLTVVEGTTDAGKSDFYKITALEGQRIAFQLLSQTLNSAMDPVLILRDASGKSLFQADDSLAGPDAAFDYTFAMDGDYYLEILDSRFAGGHVYHLRIGDFPLAKGLSPLAYSHHNVDAFQVRGPEKQTTVAFSPNQSQSADYQTVSAKFADGQSSQWFRVWNSPSPVFVESEVPPETAINVPATISGHLSDPGEQDIYTINLTKGQSLRFDSITRQIDRPTLLHMSIYSVVGAKLMETPVTDADQWSLVFSAPEEGSYQLRVRDLLNRGGAEYGYVISVFTQPSIDVAFKAEASTVRQFPLEVASPDLTQFGAGAITLQVSRFGYDGQIDLSFATESETLQILNPQIPAGVSEAIIYVRATEKWTGDAHAQPVLLATASGNPAIRSVASGLALHRITSPHNPFPYSWDNGRIAFSSVPSSEAWFSLESSEPIKLAKHLKQHTFTLSIKRLKEDFKTPVTLLPTLLPTGWSMQSKLEGDLLNITLSTPDSTESKRPDDLPEEITLVAFAQHGGRGRATDVKLPVTWFDPVDPQLHTPSTLVAGTHERLTVQLNREGAGPQPVTLNLIDLPPGIVPAINPITVSAEANEAFFDLSFTHELAGSNDAVIKVEAAGVYAGGEYKIHRQTEPFATIPFPSDIVVYPERIALFGKRDRQRIVVMGQTANANDRDWTSWTSITAVDASIADIQDGVVHAVADGETELLLQLGTLEKRIPLRVQGTGETNRIAFENEVLVALSKQGCNSGACHGSPSGKGGFRLSLRAFDKQLDELTVIREEFGRRVNLVEPSKSLLLEKPLMKVGHGGGKQLREHDEAFQILRDWIGEGAKPDPPETARCVRVEVFPSDKMVLDLASGKQQIAATAHYADGTSRDVTHLVAYECTNNTVATVDAYGKVTAKARGEAVILVRYLEHIRSVPLMFVEAVDGFEWHAPEPANYIDRLVNEKLARLQYLPSPTCTDEEFIRRVYLDVVGILPTVEQTQEFLHDQAIDKRATLIDALLERDEYAKFWALKWGDLLKTTSKLLGGDGVYKYHRWVQNAFENNMPYDQFAKELLTASGSTLANPPANFYRTAKDMNESVENISQVFLGARLQCAKCHNHPFEHWTQDNYYGLGAFFQRVQRRNTQRPGEMFIWYSDSGEVTQPRTGQKMEPWLPGKGSINESISKDRREMFAEWLINPENPFFAKIEANRIWSQLFARGIVDPIDDFRDSNPPTNESLLEALAQDFIASGYDRKHLIRTILNSRTYQASMQASPLNESGSVYFSHQVPRLLSAEQLLDAINHVTGVNQTFGNLPANTLATHLPAPDIVKVDFLRTFGQPERTTVCECEREDQSNLGMAIELFNGSAVHEKLTHASNRFRNSLAAGKEIPDVSKELYLAALCRPPSADELSVAVNHCDKSESPAKGLEDICWALLNRDEFLFQH